MKNLKLYFLFIALAVLFIVRVNAIVITGTDGYHHTSSNPLDLDFNNDSFTDIHISTDYATTLDVYGQNGSHGETDISQVNYVTKLGNNVILGNQTWNTYRT